MLAYVSSLMVESLNWKDDLDLVLLGYWSSFIVLFIHLNLFIVLKHGYQLDLSPYTCEEDNDYSTSFFSQVFFLCDPGAIIL